MTVDRISQLPNPILNLILSCLHSTEEAVRTSVLSTRWRYVWTSIPSLVLDCSRFADLSRGKEKKKKNVRKNSKLMCGTKPLDEEKKIFLVKNKFKEFVYWVLANGTLDLDSFSLDCGNLFSDHSDMLTIKRWFRIAVIRKVSHLAFFHGDNGAIMLPRSVDYESLQDLYPVEHQTMKISNQSKAPIPEVDRISSLPDRILHMILSRLNSTEAVVRMSVLSTRWRYLWTSVPSLDIDFLRGQRSYKYIENLLLEKKYKFTEFMYWVLANRILDLDNFTLNCSEYCDFSIIGRWIHLVVMRKVKQLDMTFDPEDKDEAILLPRCLVDCDSLEVLKLNLWLHPLSLKRFTGSMTLKVLELRGVKLLDRKIVKKFLVNCPLLEELYLMDCITHNLKSLVISCPNLKTLRINNKGLKNSSRSKIYENERLCEWLTVLCPKLMYLAYEGHMANHFAFNVKSLKKAVIELEDRKQNAETYDNFGLTIRELFAQVSHVECLSINYFFVQSISFMCECSNRLEEVFHQYLPNLKTLELTIDCYLKDRLLLILKCFPNLESLHLIIHKDISPKELETFVEKLDEVETRTILTRHLKKVEFLKYSGERETLAIAQFLLEHGSALEKLVFSWNNKDKYNKLSMEAMDEVKKFYKASLSVK